MMDIESPAASWAELERSIGELLNPGYISQIIKLEDRQAAAGHNIRRMATAVARSMAAAIELKVPATTLWDTIKNPEVVPKLMPEYVSSCEYLEGDGGVGSIRLMKFGPAVAHFVTFSKERIDAVDDSSKKLAYSVFEGELMNYFKSYKVSVELVQGVEDKGCTLNWSLEYEPINPDMPPPEISKEGAISTFKAVEAYLLGINNESTK
ncbi:hypothetical protein GOP47_0008591 [Adiantum capillus-veneris]|uniref:Bet v I/Major latex protein domain-containing protein n=1 Tax=Adiantum capillus-veneris TaxID=13818 RepID=A0A9D4ZKK5_ADICA|nr:hypothetical protein GOP47_0008591 [Adiantum capillus-veneris]